MAPILGRQSRTAMGRISGSMPDGPRSAQLQRSWWVVASGDKERDRHAVSKHESTSPDRARLAGARLKLDLGIAAPSARVAERNAMTRALWNRERNWDIARNSDRRLGAQEAIPMSSQTTKIGHELEQPKGGAPLRGALRKRDADSAH